LFISVWCK